jgi:hypothetical protein
MIGGPWPAMVPATASEARITVPHSNERCANRRWYPIEIPSPHTAYITSSATTSDQAKTLSHSRAIAATIPASGSTEAMSMK